MANSRSPIRPSPRLVLGVETSCDETAAALVGEDKRVLASAVLSQIAEHAPYGGVVPEIAARSHIDHLDRLIGRVMSEAGVGYDALSAVAATAGPGLIGGLLVGVMTGKAIAAARGCPFIAVNHLEAHALSPRLVAPVEFPYLLLLVSGGHCQLLVVHGVGRFRRLGTTIDDAVGEAFDKAAKLLGLPYPGGPAVERAAASGNPRRFSLPRPLLGRPGCDFSFSGLKTALAHTVQQLERAPDAATVADLAASFQAAVGDAIVDRTTNAIALARATTPAIDRLVVAGGVAANRFLRERLATLAASRGLTLTVPPAALCTDNAEMVAWAGLERLREGLVDPLDAPTRARWPLDPTTDAARAVEPAA